MKIEPQMKGVPPLEQAQRAIRHTLSQIATRGPVAYYLGHGTQTLSLLVEALATIESQPIAVIQETFTPAPKETFAEDEFNQCPFCGSRHIDKAETVCTHAFECAECCAVGPECETEDEAHAAWNNRIMPR
jgi:hypothetical protein